MNNDAKRRKRRRKLSRGTKTCLFLIILATVFLTGNIMYQKMLFRFFITVLPVRISVLESSLPVEFLIIKDETVVEAPFAGTFSPSCQEGQRVAKGSTVGFLSGTKGTSLEGTQRVNITSPTAGIVSFNVDGYEKICQPQKWITLNLDGFRAVDERLDQNRSRENKKDGYVQEGQGLFKIINNLEPVYLYTELTDLPTEQFAPGNKIELRLKSGDNNVPVTGRLVDVYTSDAGKHRVFIEVLESTGIEMQRKTNGEIIQVKHRGVVINEKMLVTKDGMSGVFILEKGRVAWRRVNVFGQVESRLAVEGLNEGEFIISTPHLVQENQWILFFQLES